MKIPFIMLIGIIGIHFVPIDSKVLTRCEIAKELRKHNFPMTFLSNWVCLIESESGGDTSKYTQTALRDKCGIFQISSGDWCGRGFVGGSCHINCEDLLSDKIDADIKCAKKIYDRHGFKWWKGWESKCKQKTLPNVSSCFFK